MVKTSVKPW